MTTVVYTRIAITARIPSFLGIETHNRAGLGDFLLLSKKQICIYLYLSCNYISSVYQGIGIKIMFREKNARRVPSSNGLDSDARARGSAWRERTRQRRADQAATTGRHHMPSHRRFPWLVLLRAFPPSPLCPFRTIVPTVRRAAPSLYRHSHSIRRSARRRGRRA